MCGCFLYAATLCCNAMRCHSQLTPGCPTWTCITPARRTSCLHRMFRADNSSTFVTHGALVYTVLRPWEARGMLLPGRRALVDKVISSAPTRLSIRSGASCVQATALRPTLLSC